MIKFGIPFFSALLGALVFAILNSLQSNNFQANNAGNSADIAGLIATLEQRISSLEAIVESNALPPPGGMSDEEKVSLFERVGLDATTIAAILSNEKEIQQLFVVAEKRRQNPAAQVQEKLRELQLMIGDNAYSTYLEATGREAYIEIESVTAGSNAEMAGVLPGDRLTHYAGERIFTPLDLKRVVEGLSKNTRKSVTLKRADTVQQIELSTDLLGGIARGGYAL